MIDLVSGRLHRPARMPQETISEAGPYLKHPRVRTDRRRSPAARRRGGALPSGADQGGFAAFLTGPLPPPGPHRDFVALAEGD